MSRSKRSPDEQTFVDAGIELRGALIEAIPGWIDSLVADRCPGAAVAADTMDRVVQQVQDGVGERMDALIAADIDEPRSGPLEIVRSSTGPLTELLRTSNVVPPRRDPFAEAARPDDIYDLGPMSFLELGPGVHDAGIRWGAGKAFLHRRRHPPGSQDD